MTQDMCRLQYFFEEDVLLRLVLIISREEFSTFLDTDDLVVETRDGKTKHCNSDFDVEGRVPVAHGTDGDAGFERYVQLASRYI